MILKLNLKVNHCLICIYENMRPERWVKKGQIKRGEAFLEEVTIPEVMGVCEDIF